MLESVTFIPRVKPPTLFRIWILIIIISAFLFIIPFIATKSLIIGLILNIAFLPAIMTTKHHLKVVISPEDKVLKYFYLSSWGTEGVCTIDILSAEGSYKYVTIYSSKHGMQLSIFNQKNKKITLSEGAFQKFQLDQMVRMINQIKKGIFVADVGTEF